MSTEAYVIDCKLKEIKERMYTDNQVRLLAIQMKQGWPSNKGLVLLEIKEYYQYRETLSKNDGLVYSGHAILIPPTVRRDTLHKLQKSHQGIVKTAVLVTECAKARLSGQHLRRIQVLYVKTSRKIINN